MPDTILLVWWAHVAATWALVGLIWVVQLVLYPGLVDVGAPGFAGFHAESVRRMTWVVAPLMAAELLGAAAVTASPPDFLRPSEAWLGLALVGVCWVSTVAVQVPLHRRLSAGPDVSAQNLLVSTNWIRTAAWTVRGAGVLAISLRV